MPLRSAVRPYACWATAVLLTALPWLRYRLLYRGGEDGEHYLYSSHADLPFEDCRGLMASWDWWRIPLLPDLVNRPHEVLAVMAAVAVGAFLLGRTGGGRRLVGGSAGAAGRATTWAGVAFLALVSLRETALLGFDLAVGPHQGGGCLALWRDTTTVEAMSWQLYYVLPGLVLLAALWSPGRAARLLGRAGMTICLVGLFLAPGDRPTEKPIILADHQSCADLPDLVVGDQESRVEAINRIPLDTRRQMFVCRLRGYRVGDEAADIEPHPSLARRSDAYLLSEGSAICRILADPARTLHSDVEIYDMTRRWGSGAEKAVDLLCPERIALNAPEYTRPLSDPAEEAAYRAGERAHERACKAPRSHGPKPSKQRIAYRGGFGEVAAYALAEETGDADSEAEAGEDAAFDEAQRNGLAGSKGSFGLVFARREVGHVCLIIRAYRSAPPKEPGWSRTAEFSLASPHGRTDIGLYLEGGWDPLRVTWDGPGTYRVRIAERLRGENLFHLLQIWKR